MADPAVSVIMNCFNGARYLREALESVLAQTCGDWELIFWDNRSTDDSATIAGSYYDARIRYFRAPAHTTLGEARRLASAKIRGRWIAMLDCDDLWRANKLERQLEQATVGPRPGFVYARTAIRWEGAGPAPVDHVFQRAFPEGLPRGDIYRKLLRGNFISVPSLLLNRDAFEAVGGFLGRYPIMEDYYITLNIARRYPVSAVDEILCEYRLHDANASRKVMDNFEDLEIVRGLYPDVAAVGATFRIVGRNLLKCARERRAPRLGRMFAALAGRGKTDACQEMVGGIRPRTTRT